MPLRLDRGLAILGASPRLDTPLHVGCPNIPDRQALDRRIDDAGPAVSRHDVDQICDILERAFAQSDALRSPLAPLAT
jgi:hypothetical protein